MGDGRNGSDTDTNRDSGRQEVSMRENHNLKCTVCGEGYFLHVKPNISFNWGCSFLLKIRGCYYLHEGTLFSTRALCFSSGVNKPEVIDIETQKCPRHFTKMKNLLQCHFFRSWVCEYSIA